MVLTLSTIPVEAALKAVRNGENPELTTRQKHTRECFVVLEEGADACFDGLPFLERIPVFQWNILLFRSLSREFSLAENLKGIAITEYIMVHFKSRNTIAI